MRFVLFMWFTTFLCLCISTKEISFYLPIFPPICDGRKKLDVYRLQHGNKTNKTAAQNIHNRIKDFCENVSFTIEAQKSETDLWFEDDTASVASKMVHCALINLRHSYDKRAKIRNCLIVTSKQPKGKTRKNIMNVRNCWVRTNVRKMKNDYCRRSECKEQRNKEKEMTERQARKYGCQFV